MCLTIESNKHKNNKPLVSKRKIYCYKIYFICGIEPHLFLSSPIRNKLVTKTTVKAKPHFQSKPKGDTIYFAIHAYRNIFRALISRLRNFDLPLDCLKVFKMCIPKGTKYWIGTDGEIAAEKMVFVTDISKYLSKK